MKHEMERVHRPRAQARVSYNAMARWYDLFSGSEKKFTDVGLQMLNAEQNESILEIGCGTGYALIELANSVKGGKVVAMDISEEMLKVARKRIQEHVRKRSIELCLADGVSIPFADGEFDAVFLSFTLELFDTPEIPMVLKECHRVLQAKGHIGVVSLVKQDTSAVSIYEWFHKRLPNFVDCRPIFVQPLLVEAGFAIQRSSTQSMWGLPVDIVVAGK